MRRVRVVGAGLSGLAAAWYLVRQGVGVDVVEAAPAPGGFIQTIHLPEGPVETGANGFVWTPAVERLFAGLDIAPMFARGASRRRYIYRGGRARRWPLTPAETAAMVARAGAAWITRRFGAQPGESVAAWGNRVAGRAATEWLLSPALQGIYGAAAGDLSAEAISIGRRRGRIRLAAPSEGMGALVAALHEALLRDGATVTCGQTVSSLDSAVPAMICTSAAAAAPLVAPHHPVLASAIGRIRSAPLMTATAFFEPHAGDIRGFGVLFPRGTARAFGVLVNSEIFERRGSLRSERWIFGDPPLVQAPDADVRAAILRDRRVLTGRGDAMRAMHATG